MRARSRIIHKPGGLHFYHGKAGGGDFWDPNNVGLSVIGAWRAIDTPGSPWGAGPANYAASLLDLTGNGNNLTEIGGGPPNWGALVGWSGFSVLNRCLDTGLIPVADQSWSMFVQIANAANNAPFTIDAGVWNGNPAVNDLFQVSARSGGGINVTYANGAFIVIGPAIVNGNLGIAGNRGYRNGVAEGAALGAWGNPSTNTVYIGARNDSGVASWFCNSEIRAAILYNGGSAAVQGQALAITAATAAL